MVTNLDTPQGSMASSTRPLLSEIIFVLKSLYHRGIISWGQKHSNDFRMAVRSTGLAGEGVYFINTDVHVLDLISLN